MTCALKSLLVIGLLALAAMDSVYADAPTKPHYKTTVSFQTAKYGAMLIQVKLFGKDGSSVVANFILDSGTNYSYVAPELATRLDLKPMPLLDKSKPISLSGRPMEMVTIPSMQIGTFPINAMPLVLLDEKYLTSMYDQPVAGGYRSECSGGTAGTG